MPTDENDQSFLNAEDINQTIEDDGHNGDSLANIRASIDVDDNEIAQKEMNTDASKVFSQQASMKEEPNPKNEI